MTTDAENAANLVRLTYEMAEETTIELNKLNNDLRVAAEKLQTSLGDPEQKALALKEYRNTLKHTYGRSGGTRRGIKVRPIFQKIEDSNLILDEMEASE